MDLPEDCPLGYYVSAEAWYAKSIRSRDDKPEIMIGAYANEGGCAWEFKVCEYDLSGPTLHVEMFSDSWDAWAQAPELFTALRERTPTTLTELRVILDELGAVDKTDRKTPERYQRVSREDAVREIVGDDETTRRVLAAVDAYER